MASITLLSIPLFILKGAAIGRSRAGQDLYGALHAWLHRIPGGSGHRQRFRLRAVCRDGRLVARRPARRSALPAFRRCASTAIRGGFAAGIIAAGGTLGILLPPSITMILYAVAAEQSLGRLFLAGDRAGAVAGHVVCRLCDVAASAGNSSAAKARSRATGTHSELLRVGHDVDARQIRAAAARASVRRAADRRDGRALRRLSPRRRRRRASAPCSRWC